MPCGVPRRTVVVLAPVSSSLPHDCPAITTNVAEALCLRHAARHFGPAGNLPGGAADAYSRVLAAGGRRPSSANADHDADGPRNHPAGTITSADTSNGGSGALLIGGLGAVLAAGGGVGWYRLRKRRRPTSEAARLAPITVRPVPAPPGNSAGPAPCGVPARWTGPGTADSGLAPGTPFAEQEPALLPGPPRRAPWEQPTSVDLRWKPSQVLDSRQAQPTTPRSQRAGTRTRPGRRI